MKKSLDYDKVIYEERGHFMIYENTTIFDLETTGLDPKTSKVIEFAALRIRKGKVIGSVSYLINPEVRIPPKITEITGITNEDVEFCPTMKQIFPWLMAIFGDSLLVAHNLLFDISFIEVLNQQLRGKAVKHSFIDTRAICIDRFPYESHRLELMCQKYNIPLDGAHRALNDVEATWQLLQKLNEEKPIDQHYVNKLYYFKKYGSPDWVPPYANLEGL